MSTVLLVPGFTGSGPDHWHSHWQRERPEYLRLEQRDWNQPSLDEWVAALDAATAPEEIRCFAPTPLLRLPYRSWVVASSNDPLVSLARAQVFATAWGSAFTPLVDAGHINTASRHGPWAQGHRLLEQLLV